MAGRVRSRLIPALLLAAAPPLMQAASAQSFSDPNRANQSSVDVQGLVTDLARLVDEAERTRAADRRLIEDLRRFIDDYDRPWTRVVLDDGFADGDFARNPTWTVREGNFQVDRRYGLVGQPAAAASSSGRTSGKDIAAALIGSLLQQGTGASAPSAPAASARIETNARLSNAFALEAEVSGLAQGAGFELAVVQGQSGTTGYRLVMATGRDARLEVVRDSSRGSAVVGSYLRTLRSNASGQHRLRWTRARNGRMRVLHNGEVVLETVDRGLRDGFDRVAVIARGGDAGLRRVTAYAVP